MKRIPFYEVAPYRTELEIEIVEVRSDAGIQGFGETCPVGPIYQPHHAGGARGGAVADPQLLALGRPPRRGPPRPRHTASSVPSTRPARSRRSG